MIPGPVGHYSNRLGFSSFPRNYLKKWSAKDIQVVAWTINTFDEKNYYESHLQTSYITDSILEDCESQF